MKAFQFLYTSTPKNEQRPAPVTFPAAASNSSVSSRSRAGPTLHENLQQTTLVPFKSSEQQAFVRRAHSTASPDLTATPHRVPKLLSGTAQHLNEAQHPPTLSMRAAMAVTASSSSSEAVLRQAI